MVELGVARSEVSGTTSLAGGSVPRLDRIDDALSALIGVLPADDYHRVHNTD